MAVSVIPKVGATPILYNFCCLNFLWIHEMTLQMMQTELIISDFITMLIAVIFY